MLVVVIVHLFNLKHVLLGVYFGSFLRDEPTLLHSTTGFCVFLTIQKPAVITVTSAGGGSGEQSDVTIATTTDGDVSDMPSRLPMPGHVPANKKG